MSCRSTDPGPPANTLSELLSAGKAGDVQFPKTAGEATGVNGTG